MAGSRRDLRAPLRSLNSDEPTYVDFMNKCRRPARAWWLNFSGRPVSYGDIEPGGSMKMNTFLTHPWIFRTSECRSRLLVNMQDVYFPSPAEYKDGYPLYVEVCITSPVYSLKDCCSTLIRKKVKKEDFVKLDIPECLQKDLANSPDLLEELEILNLLYRANDQ